MQTQAGARVRHHRLTRFQEQTRQVAVDEWRAGLHLFNMLNEFPMDFTGGLPSVQYSFEFFKSIVSIKLIQIKFKYPKYSSPCAWI
jgi:hypothetical protein